MKNYLSVLACLFLFSSVAFSQVQQKTGYVDSQVILTSLPEAIKANGELEALQKKWAAQADSMLSSLQEEYASYQKQSATMTPDKQKEVQQGLIAKEQQLNLFRQQKFAQPSGEIYQKQEQLLGPIKEKIMKGIEATAKDEGMTFVFDKSGDVLLLYADTEFDITYKVLDKLKRGVK